MTITVAIFIALVFYWASYCYNTANSKKNTTMHSKRSAFSVDEPSQVIAYTSILTHTHMSGAWRQGSTPSEKLSQLQ